MKTEIYLTAKDGSYNAQAIYDSTGEITVKKGSHIRMQFAAHIRGGKTAKKYRENPAYVNEEGVTLQDCKFTSPSTAAQFVMGSSTNGWTAWHIDKKTNLKQYIERTESTEEQ